MGELGGPGRCTSAKVAGECYPLAQRTERCPERVQRPARYLSRVGKLDAAAIVAQNNASAEGTKPQDFVIELTASLGVRRVVELESAVDEVAVNLIGANAPAHGIGGFQKEHVATGVDECSRRNQASQPCAHHDDVSVIRSRGWHARERRGWEAFVQRL